jgi:hypothetical protein
MQVTRDHVRGQQTRTLVERLNLFDHGILVDSTSPGAIPRWTSKKNVLAPWNSCGFGLGSFRSGTGLRIGTGRKESLQEFCKSVQF